MEPQPQIGAWNIARFLEAISPLVENTDRLTEVLEFYISSYEDSMNQIWADKLGLSAFIESDSELIIEMNELLQKVETDMTIFFRELGSIQEPNIEELKFAFYDEKAIPNEEWNAWLAKWWERVDSNPDREKMMQTNPKYVLRKLDGPISNRCCRK